MILFHRHFGEGKPIVILHGLFGQCDNWVSVSKMLGDRHNSVFAIDLRNHGHSPHSPEFSYELMARDVADTLHDLRIQKVHLMGHSMGGKVAMLFSQLYPEMLRSVIIVDISPRYYPPHHGEIISGLKSVDILNISSRAEAENSMEPFIKNPSVRQFLLKNLFRNDKNQFRWRFNLEILSASLEKVGQSIPTGNVDVPALFYHGQNSDYVSVDEYTEIMQQFLSAEFRQMAGAGHWLHAENTEEFVQTIDHWIKRYS